MIVIAAIVLGGLWGALVARRRRGTRLDIAQYAAGYAIAAGLVAFFLALALQALLGGRP